MPLQATSGAASYDAFGGGVPSEPNYIESVFQTYLYTGNGSTQTITNGIDLAGKGGLVWNQSRSNAYGGYISDTARGTGKWIQPFNTNSQITDATAITSFNSNGFTMGSQTGINGSTGQTYASWTFRKQPKFFDVVTYTGTGVDDRQIAHSLGSTPGCVMIKRTDTTGDWVVSHNYDFGNVLFLNTTAAAIANPSSNGYFGYPANPLQPTYFTLGTNAATNASGGTYVAYLFAHNAGGFGLTGTDNVISCGSFTTDGSGTASVTLGYEPQWVLLKSATSAVSWVVLDTMRGWVNGSGASFKSMTLQPNSSAAEAAGTIGSDNLGSPTATGFTVQGVNASDTMIYIAIRRGPMKVPTSGTSVFAPTFGTNNAPWMKPTFITDLGIIAQRTSNDKTFFGDRLRGAFSLNSSILAAEQANAGFKFDYMNGWHSNSSANTDYIAWNFKRAPSFFDEVCYTGTGANRTVTHNLGVAPELMIIKKRSSGVNSNWAVYTQFVGPTQLLFLNLTNAVSTGTNTVYFNNTSPTSTVFTLGSNANVNNSGDTYVAYLFATCAGVSKVGSYTGTGTTKQVDCGFTGGARFVLIKRTDSTGDWYVWDSARGIVAGNDPYLLMNSTAAEVTNTDYVDTYSAGFEISSTAPAAINANGGTFIFLAIA